MVSPSLSAISRDGFTAILVGFNSVTSLPIGLVFDLEVISETNPTKSVEFCFKYPLATADASIYDSSDLALAKASDSIN